MATICIDLDGTLAEYHGWKGVENIGQPLAGAVEFVNGLAAKGYRIVIFTTRLNPSIIENLENKIKLFVQFKIGY